MRGYLARDATGTTKLKTLQELRNFLIPGVLNYETLMLKYISYKMHHKACPHKAELSGVVI